jgi:hypothetical protein
MVVFDLGAGITQVQNDRRGGEYYRTGNFPGCIRIIWYSGGLSGKPVPETESF